MNKLKNQKGMSLGELLVAILIMLLVSMGLVTGTALSQKQFFQSTQESEAQQLYSNLYTLIGNELRFASEALDESGNPVTNGEVDTFFSVTYALKSDKTKLVSLDEDGKETDDYGQLALGNNGTYNRLLGTASYTTYDLGAKASINYNKGTNMFTVSLEIANSSGESLVDNSFSVRALNMKKG